MKKLYSTEHRLSNNVRADNLETWTGKIVRLIFHNEIWILKIQIQNGSKLKRDVWHYQVNLFFDSLFNFLTIWTLPVWSIGWFCRRIGQAKPLSPKDWFSFPVTHEKTEMLKVQLYLHEANYSHKFLLIVLYEPKRTLREFWKG